MSTKTIKRAPHLKKQWKGRTLSSKDLSQKAPPLLLSQLSTYPELCSPVHVAKKVQMREDSQSRTLRCVKAKAKGDQAEIVFLIISMFFKVKLFSEQNFEARKRRWWRKCLKEVYAFSLARTRLSCFFQQAASAKKKKSVPETTLGPREGGGGGGGGSGLSVCFILKKQLEVVFFFHNKSWCWAPNFNPMMYPVLLR